MNNAMEFSTPLLIILVISILTSIIWMSVTFITPRVSGWINLAKEYPDLKQHTGVSFGWQSARLGLFGVYNHCLNINVSKNGFALQPVAIFRFGHEPIFIPWKAVDRFEPIPTLFGHCSKIAIRRNSSPKPFTITLFGKALAKELKRQYDLNQTD